MTKNSGGEATAAKLEAARELGVQVVMIARPVYGPAREVGACGRGGDGGGGVGVLAGRSFIPRSSAMVACMSHCVSDCLAPHADRLRNHPPYSPIGGERS